jgi:hypothetical protein
MRLEARLQAAGTSEERQERSVAVLDLHAGAMQYADAALGAAEGALGAADSKPRQP